MRSLEICRNSSLRYTYFYFLPRVVIPSRLFLVYCTFCRNYFRPASSFICSTYYTYIRHTRRLAFQIDPLQFFDLERSGSKDAHSFVLSRIARRNEVGWIFSSRCLSVRVSLHLFDTIEFSIVFEIQTQLRATYQSKKQERKRRRKNTCNNF